jgi:hypothetical protein
MSVAAEQERILSRLDEQCDELSECLPALREVLEHERNFRVEQLAELASGLAVSRRAPVQDRAGRTAPSAGSMQRSWPARDGHWPISSGRWPRCTSDSMADARTAVGRSRLRSSGRFRRRVGAWPAISHTATPSRRLRGTGTARPPSHATIAARSYWRGHRCRGSS